VGLRISLAAALGVALHQLSEISERVPTCSGNSYPFSQLMGLALHTTAWSRWQETFGAAGCIRFAKSG
jgi:hypothetical protein